MTTSHHSSQDADPSADWSEQCLLYLFAELDADQSRDFERRLQSSPALAEELLRQAGAITAVASTPTGTLSTGTLSTGTLSTGTSVLPGPTTRSPLPWVAALAALAACIAVIAIGIRPLSSNRSSIASLSDTSDTLSSDSEDLLIARAWADNQHSFPPDDVALAHSDRDDSLMLATDESSEDDTSLSWMFVGVSAGVDTETGAKNDG